MDKAVRVFTTKQRERAADMLGIKSASNLEIDMHGGIWLVNWYLNKYGEKAGFAHRQLTSSEYRDFIGR